MKEITPNPNKDAAAWARKEWESDAEFWQRMQKTETGIGKLLANLVVNIGQGGVGHAEK